MNNSFDTYGMSAEQVMLVNSEFESKKKNKTVVVLLWAFMAPLAGHRFFLGNTGYAVAMLLLGWCTLFIWPLVDIIFALKETDRQNERIRQDAINRARMIQGGHQNIERPAAVRYAEYGKTEVVPQPEEKKEEI